MSLLDPEEKILSCLNDSYIHVWDDWCSEYNTPFTKEMRQLIKNMMFVCKDITRESILGFFTNYLKHPETKKDYSCIINNYVDTFLHHGKQRYEICLKCLGIIIVSIYIREK